MQLGIMDFNARFYSPALGRFVQPDSIIPDLTNSQPWNRYSYVSNNPLKQIDPTGHKQICIDGAQCADTEPGVYNHVSVGENLLRNEHLSGLSPEEFLLSNWSDPLGHNQFYGYSFGNNRGPKKDDPRSRYHMAIDYKPPNIEEDWNVDVYPGYHGNVVFTNNCSSNWDLGCFVIVEHHVGGEIF